MKNKRLLFLLAAVNFTHISDLVIVMPLGDKFMDLWSINPKQFGIVMSAYTLAAAVSSLGASFFIDKFDRRHALLVTYVGFALGTLACAFAPGYMSLVAARALTGFFGGMIGALVLAIISDLYPLEKRGSAMGIITGALAVAIILGLPMGLILANAYDWHAPFLVLGALSLSVAVAIFFVMPALTAHKDPAMIPQASHKFFSSLLRDKNQVRAILLAGMLILAALLVIAFVPSYLKRNVGMSDSDLNFILLLGGVVTMISTPILGKLTDRFGAKDVFTFLILMAIIPIIAITHLGQASTGLVFVITSALFIFVLGQLVPGQTIITAAVGPQSRGGFMSIKSAMQQFSAAVATFLGGALMTNPQVKETFSGGNQPPLEHFNVVGMVAAGICILAVFVARGIKVADGNRMEIRAELKTEAEGQKSEI